MYSSYDKEYLEVIFCCLKEILDYPELDKLDEILSIHGFGAFKHEAMNMIAGEY